MLIGNDLVDLGARAARGKAGDDLFLRRVFTPGEADYIRGSADPDGTLWRLWAAKEAAFKIVRKLQPELPFRHRAYEIVADEVEEAEGEPGFERATGRVWLRDMEDLGIAALPVEWEAAESLLHCVAMEPGPTELRVWRAVATLGKLSQADSRYEPSERELTSCHSAESIAVRHLATGLARDAGLGEVEIVREASGRSFGPPLLFSRGGRAPLGGWDISLSHDGEAVAAVLRGGP